MPASGETTYDGYYNTSPECWSVYTEVLGSEFNNALLFGQVHQLTVDSYAVQHAGGAHPDKSIAIHLSGLHLVLDRGVASPAVPPFLQRLAGAVREWPHFTPPTDMGSVTVCDIALSDSVKDHIEGVRRWAGFMWKAWHEHHAAVKDLVTRHLTLE